MEDARRVALVEILCDDHEGLHASGEAAHLSGVGREGVLQEVVEERHGLVQLECHDLKVRGALFGHRGWP